MSIKRNSQRSGWNVEDQKTKEVLNFSHLGSVRADVEMGTTEIRRNKRNDKSYFLETEQVLKAFKILINEVGWAAN